MTTDASRRVTAQKKIHDSAAETLISASYEAQSQLTGPASGALIPAMAESPIPVLAPRNRTPNPRDTHRKPRRQAADAA